MRPIDPLMLLLLLPSLALGADFSVPHSPANRVIAENLHATDQAFKEVHELVDSLSTAYHEIRERFEAAILRLVGAFDPRQDSIYVLVQRIGELSEQLVAELGQQIGERYGDMDELVQIAVELHDTNLNLCAEEPEAKETMGLLQGMRNTKYGQVGKLLTELHEQTALVRKRKLGEALRVAELLGSGKGQARAHVKAQLALLGRVFDEMLDEQRAIVLVSRARSQTIMAALEHQFRELSLALTLAESRAHVEQAGGA